MNNVKQYEGYKSFDVGQDDWWARFFCVEMPDRTCGMLLGQHHFNGDFPFDIRTELNLGFISGGTVEQALQSADMSDANRPIYPATMRRVARLMTQGDMMERVKDTVSERGLLRAVAYSPENKTPEWLKRAGFEQEMRGDTTFYILDL